MSGFRSGVLVPPSMPWTEAGRVQLWQLMQHLRLIGHSCRGASSVGYRRSPNVNELLADPNATATGKKDSVLLDSCIDLALRLANKVNSSGIPLPQILRSSFKLFPSPEYLEAVVTAVGESGTRGPVPCARWAACAAVVGTKMVLFGGEDGASTALGDLSSYTPGISNGAPPWASLTAQHPTSPRKFASLLSLQKCVVVFDVANCRSSECLLIIVIVCVCRAQTVLLLGGETEQGRMLMTPLSLCLCEIPSLIPICTSLISTQKKNTSPTNSFRHTLQCVDILEL